MLKTVSRRPFSSPFRLFWTIFRPPSSQIPNSFRKSRPHTASPAKPPCRKWSHTNYLSMRFSIKRVTKSRKNVIFLSVFHIFEKVGSFFFEKPVFHFKPSEASFFLGDVSCLKVLGKSQMAVGKYKPELCRREPCQREPCQRESCQREPARVTLGIWAWEVNNLL